MGYPVYKLLRAVNRQYPNNGFINYVDVRDDMYDTDDPETNKIIDEDLRDLINETLQETYINVARDEVFSFPTVPGQREYVLPDDCDLRDIQEVTRTFRGNRGPWVPPPSGLTRIYSVTFYSNEGEGTMEPIEANIGETITLPECEFTPPEGYVFKCWNIGEKEYEPGDQVSMYANLTATAVWEKVRYEITLTNMIEDIDKIVVKSKPLGGSEEVQDLLYGHENQIMFLTGPNGTLGEGYSYIRLYINDSLYRMLDMNEVYEMNTGYTYFEYDGSEISDSDTIESHGFTIKYASGGATNITVVSKSGDSETAVDLSIGETTTFSSGTTTGSLGDNYEYIGVYFNGRPIINYDMTEILTRDVLKKVAVPAVLPEGEQPGDNQTTLEDLEVTPIDNGNGGYANNPLNGGNPLGGD